MKKILLLFICITLCGCQADYNLTIKDNKFEENLSAYLPFDNYNDYDYSKYLNNKIPVLAYSDIPRYYKASGKIGEEYYIINYKYSNLIKDLSKSYLVKNCYGDVFLREDSGKIVIKTDKFFKCINREDNFHVDNVNVNIITPHKVLSHNADKVNGNVYTWIIDRDNYINKPINITIENNKNVINKVKNTINNVNNFELHILLIGLVIFVVIICIIVKGNKNKNEI